MGEHVFAHAPLSAAGDAMDLTHEEEEVRKAETMASRLTAGLIIFVFGFGPIVLLTLWGLQILTD